MTGLREGVVELSRNWAEPTPPPLILQGTGISSEVRWETLDAAKWALRSGFTCFGDRLCFILDLSRVPWVSKDSEFWVAGDFTQWGDTLLTDRWKMRRQEWAGQPAAVLELKVRPGFLARDFNFKFITGEGEWLPVWEDAPNLLADEAGNRNFQLSGERTGHHSFRFSTAEDLVFCEDLTVRWEEGGEACALWPNALYLKLRDEGPLGAFPSAEGTLFRVYAPRATALQVQLFASTRDKKTAPRIPMEKDGELCWRAWVPGRHQGWFYWYFADGKEDPWSHFDADHPILDPYAKATIGHAGPGIILADEDLAFPFTPFQPPPWHDLVIAEAHVRDLIAKAPVKMKRAERLCFKGLTKWIQSDDFYLHRLGVNAVELQPIQENDAAHRLDYHWGYMTNNYFSPESTYSLAPGKASGVREFQEVVEAFHQRGTAVILDVVYNHVGVPGHLLYLDKYAYFELNPEGYLMNWSGCGNDLRASSGMGRRLIIDSLIHLVKTYNVDGFRFDLAELLGVSVLVEIERALKKIKPGIILIAEPWSFRGHIAAQLRDTGFASWNDGYRDFVAEYLREEGNHDGLRYFLTGSPDHFARWPAQTVNYTQSHDDYCWIDRITEKENHDGREPTLADIRRTHLMASLLTMSLGIPMFASGQDFLQSKEGVHNTYQRGDLNALDYDLMGERDDSHRYFAQWIRFRRSSMGRLLRRATHPPSGYFYFFHAPDSSSLAVLYNAERRELNGLRILYAINPHDREVWIPYDGLDPAHWVLQADAERFFWGMDSAEIRSGADLREHGILLGPLECGLWVERQ